MRKEDLRDWTRNRLKDEVVRLHNKLDLFGIKFEEKPNNFSFSYHGNRYWAGRIVNDIVALKEENENLKSRIKKIESGICGDGIIFSQYHTFKGESWIRAEQYDDVLLRLQKANERINKLEAESLNKTIDRVREIDRIKKENVELEAENKALRQQIQGMEDVCDGSCFSDEEDDRNKLIAELQDQHQQDCIRINDLTTTINVLSGLYSTLRKTVGWIDVYL